MRTKEINSEHQFGFRAQYSTTKQTHRVVTKIRHYLESKRYCSAVFMDISQELDKVWHSGLLYKIKRALPHNYYQVLQSYKHTGFSLLNIKI